ncbi:methyl-accepting chemotaxis protein [Desulfohalotomaculum tongense]|uniref:methyl-accepting chemotaxis protein n=1 Tax=Desulforadius tongensis TaxID=1216062 RepID=UPI00195A430B|nr:methyl-accepting chemotaxis protein [Desulforadius tongensis]MBM7855682.1 methyl-accepting chemotaxis protein [Desulforadius tongensis]
MAYNRLSLKYKLLFLMVLMSAIPSIIIFSILYQKAESGLERELNAQLERAVSAANRQLEEKSNELLNLARWYVQEQELTSAFKNNDRALLAEKAKPIYERLKREHQVDVFEFGDKKGVVFFRAHNPGKFGDDKSSNDSIRASLQGKEAAGLEFGSSGLAMRALVPVKSEGRVIGTFQLGLDSRFLNEIEESVSAGVALYNRDVLISTSSEENKDKIGRSLEDKSIYQRVSNGETVRTVEQNYMKVYIPLKNATGEKVIGMLGIEEDISSLQKIKERFWLTSITVVVIAILVAVVISVIFSRKIAGQVQAATEFAEEIAQGNLTVERLNNSSKDEIGVLSSALNKMKANLEEMAFSINEKSNNLSAFAEELSANTEETSANASEISSIMTEVATTMEQVAQNSQTIKESADETVGEAEKGQQNMAVVHEQMNDISRSTYNTAAVIQGLNKTTAKIGEIVSSITQIADQTNLLALNAAIEAARAGEHGKGFAVVAEEVRKLAEMSSKSTTEIQELLSSVQAESNKAGEVMRETVNKVQSGVEIVNNTAQSFEQIIDKVKILADEIEEIASGTKQVSAAVQNATGITEESTAAMQEIASAVETLTQWTNELQQMAARFQINSEYK